ncbi:MAG: hypothetical protein M1819_001885 [Sarea resinae]|nr:MAG: hypothetical protein M1819_001885 [Sarea resinae]
MNTMNTTNTTANTSANSNPRNHPSVTVHINSVWDPHSVMRPFANTLPEWKALVRLRVKQLRKGNDHTLSWEDTSKLNLDIDYRSDVEPVPPPSNNDIIATVLDDFDLNPDAAYMGAKLRQETDQLRPASDETAIMNALKKWIVAIAAKYDPTVEDSGPCLIRAPTDRRFKGYPAEMMLQVHAYDDLHKPSYPVGIIRTGKQWSPVNLSSEVYCLFSLGLQAYVRDRSQESYSVCLISVSRDAIQPLVATISKTYFVSSLGRGEEVFDHGRPTTLMGGTFCIERRRLTSRAKICHRSGQNYILRSIFTFPKSSLPPEESRGDPSVQGQSQPPVRTPSSPFSPLLARIPHRQLASASSQLPYEAPSRSVAQPLNPPFLQESHEQLVLSPRPLQLQTPSQPPVHSPSPQYFC